MSFLQGAGEEPGEGTGVIPDMILRSERLRPCKLAEAADQHAYSRRRSKSLSDPVSCHWTALTHGKRSVEAGSWMTWWRFLTCGPSINVVMGGVSFDMVLGLHRAALFRRYQSNQEFRRG